MIALLVFEGLTSSHQTTLQIEETDMARADAAKRNHMPARVTDQTTGAQYEIAWIDIGSSYRGHVILRCTRPAACA